MWHGVPILCMPGFGDQPDMAARPAHHGAGLALPYIWKAKEEEVYAALLRLITEPSFKENAQKLSRRLRAAKQIGPAAAAGGPFAEPWGTYLFCHACLWLLTVGLKYRHSSGLESCNLLLFIVFYFRCG
jgi:hypothetical protein